MAAIYYLSFTTDTLVPGVGTVKNVDIVAYNADTDTWTLYFDGSDVGLGGGATDLDALHVRSDGSILISLSAASFDVPGLTGGPSGTTVEDSDVILFTGTTGPATSGSFSFYFDGSDVGLDTDAENIDGLYEFADGSLGISTLGTFDVNGAAGVDEDVIRFTGSFGAATSGTFTVHFDGSDEGFAASASNDLNAVSFDADVDMLFSTTGAYSAAGGSGDNEDVSRFTGTFGPATSGTAALELDLTGLGIDPTENVDGLSFEAIPDFAVGACPSGPVVPDLEDPGTGFFPNVKTLPLNTSDKIQVPWCLHVSQSVTNVAGILFRAIYDESELDLLHTGGAPPIGNITPSGMNPPSTLSGSPLTPLSSTVTPLTASVPGSPSASRLHLGWLPPTTANGSGITISASSSFPFATFSLQARHASMTDAEGDFSVVSAALIHHATQLQFGTFSVWSPAAQSFVPASSVVTNEFYLPLDAPAPAIGHLGVVPEPGALLQLFSGGLGLAWLQRCRMRNRRKPSRSST